MSIASRITSIEGHIEEDYNALERLGADLTGVNKNIENIASVVNDIYDKLPKVTGTGSNLSLTPTLKGGLSILPLGNCEQSGTPTPDNPIDVKVVTGDNQVVVSTGNLLDSKGGFERGYISSTGVFNAEDYTALFNQYIPINENITLTLSSKYSLSSCAFIFYDENKSFISRSANSNVTSFTVTTPQNTKYIKIQVSRQTQLITQEVIDTLELQVEFGSTVTSYKEYKGIQSYTLHLGSLELCKIGDYQDVITGSKDNWKVVRNIGKVVLNGSESWEFFWATSGIFINRNANIISGTNTINGLSNYFTATTRTNIRNNLLTVDNLIAFTRNELVIAYKLAQTIDDFKNWLSTHNTIAYYILKEQVEETITDTTLINELNGLQELLSYDGTTNITITSDNSNAQMLVQVSALKG